MESIKIIKRRIKSAQNISQITRAMEMVAASKMKKAQDLAVFGKPYAEKIYQMTRELAGRVEKKFHPLLSLGNQDGKTLVIVISSNKGLCGGLNSNLFKMVYSWFPDQKNTDYVTLGKKGENFIVRSNRNLLADFSETLPFTVHIPAVTKIVIDGFLAGTYKEVYVTFNMFINALKQIPTKKQILPISALGNTQEDENEDKNEKITEFLIEPTVGEVLDSLLPHYLENQIRAATLEAEASEHSARMIAMKNATDAAIDLMGALTLIYNKARQEKITTEIADMVTARMAVE